MAAPVYSGQLGHGDLARRSRPTAIQVLSKVSLTKVACGEIHAAALDRYRFAWAHMLLARLQYLARAPFPSFHPPFPPPPTPVAAAAALPSLSTALACCTCGDLKRTGA